MKKETREGAETPSFHLDHLVTTQAPANAGARWLFMCWVLATDPVGA